MRFHPVLAIALALALLGCGRDSDGGTCARRLIRVSGHVVCSEQGAAVVLSTTPVLGGLRVLGGGGAASTTLPVSNGRFEGTARFEAFDYWAREFSCGRVPEYVQLDLVVAGKVRDSVRLSAARDFDRDKVHNYQLKADIVLRCKK